MKKINIVGTSGSGKSTFAKALASQLNIKYIEMDALFWRPNWQHSPDEKFFDELTKELTMDSYVLDGNYSRTQHIKSQYIETTIWLDYSFIRTFCQVLIRSIKRAYYKNELWPNTGNKESFKKTFLQRDSIILWMLSNYFANKRKYNALMQDCKLKNKEFIRITSPKKARQLLTELSKNGPLQG